jgi:hypothetical protein
MSRPSNDRLAFARSHLRAGPVALVPEVVLYQAEEPIGLWELTEATVSLHCHSGPRPPDCPFREDDGQGGERHG